MCFSMQPISVCSRSTQTAAQNVSVGLQTDILTSSRMAGLHSKSWSPRASPTTTSSLVSARTRQISTSLDKVHSRIDRPCCSPKYGSPKLQRRVSSGKKFLKIYFNYPFTCSTFPLQFHNFLCVKKNFRLHLKIGLQQGPKSVEPPAEAYRWRWRGLRLGSLHHHQGQPRPEWAHRRTLQPLQCGGAFRKHGVTLEG